MLLYLNFLVPLGCTGTTGHNGLPVFLNHSSESQSAGRCPYRVRSCNQEVEHEETGGKAVTGQGPPGPSPCTWTWAEFGVRGKTWNPKRERLKITEKSNNKLIRV